MLCADQKLFEFKNYIQSHEFLANYFEVGATHEHFCMTWQYLKMVCDLELIFDNGSEFGKFGKTFRLRYNQKSQMKLGKKTVPQPDAAPGR